jgi:dTDP-glucose pyrophosphorylase
LFIHNRKHRAAADIDGNMIDPTDTILLCAGPINFTNLPVGTTQSNAMLPVNGKPVIGWILDDLREKGITAATVVLQEKDKRLAEFVGWAYSSRLQLTLAKVNEGGSILHSLQAGLGQRTGTSSVRIILGDTLISDPYHSDDDFVYASLVDNSLDWCVADLDESGWILRYHDKQELSGKQFWALAGYYHLQDGSLLAQCVEQSLEAGETNLSDVLSRYSSRRPITGRPAQSWLDFGHIENFVEARRALLRPRFFNTLKINPVLNTITKISERDEKLQDELDWYEGLPEPLKVLTPRILGSRRVNGYLEITQEYYGYPTLAELYLYGNLRHGVWDSILKQLFRIHQEFQRYPAELCAKNLEKVYIQKTGERLGELEVQDEFWGGLLAQREIVYNGKTLQNYRQLESQICQFSHQLAGTIQGCIIHGDFCFSNILFDVNNQIVRLIDPRGSFGSKGIYGDPRYDIAKLRHSLAGLYDHMVADLFELRQAGPAFQSCFFMDGSHGPIQELFDKLLVENGFVLDEIKFIEGLLFLTMPPLHREHPERQKIMYLTGLSLLNEVLDANHH